MGTVVRVTLYAPDSDRAVTALRLAFDRIRELGTRFSDYRSDSELSQVCERAAQKPVQVSEELFRVLEASAGLAADTRGAFDITTGAVNRLWREARRRKQLPSAADLQQAVERTGHAKVVLHRENRTVFLKEAGIQLDLGGIAKGFIADEALAVLRRAGIDRAMVAIGGDLAIGSPPPGEDGWQIGVDATGPRGGLERVLTLRNCGVSTSGDREQFFEAGGKRYSHIVDPEFGTGLTDGLSATVIAPSGMLADGLATAVRVMGEKRSQAFVEGRPCIIVLLTNAAGSSWFLPPNSSPAAYATDSWTHGCLPRNGSIP